MNTQIAKFSTEEINLLLNAIQLCIKSTLKSMRVETVGHNSIVTLIFLVVEHPDPKLTLVTDFLPGQWLKSHYVFRWPDQIRIDELTQFLMLTRLESKSMLKLAEIDPRFKKYINNVTLKRISVDRNLEVQSIEDAARLIRNEIKLNNLTLRTISQQCGLTQASLHRFKSGSDIRLSNFLKLLETLNLEMTLSPKVKNT